MSKSKKMVVNQKLKAPTCKNCSASLRSIPAYLNIRDDYFLCMSCYYEENPTLGKSA